MTRHLGFSSLWMSLLVLAFGCGEPEKSNDPSNEKPLTQKNRIENDRRPYRNYFLQDSGCQNQSDPVQITSGEIYQRTESDPGAIAIDFVGLQTTGSLNSPYINKTTYGAQYNRTCDFAKEEGQRCRDSEGKEKSWLGIQGQNLRLCRPHADYPRRSYEGVAAASAAYLYQAAKAYESALGHGAPQPVELWILPEFKESYQNYRSKGKEYILDTYIVNNLAYFPGSKAIAVFPEKHNSLGTASEAFWESPFVLAHEFGHHVESLLTPAEVTSSSLTWDPISHSYKSLTVGLEEAKSLRVLGHKFKLEKVKGSLSEGFADLIAYYSLAGDRESLLPLPCGLSCNRDIVAAEFYGGDKKELSDTTIEYLFGLQSHAPCHEKGYEPCLAEIHNVGAIFSYALNRLAKQLTEARAGIEPGSAQDFQSRYQLLARWYETVVLEMDKTDFALVEDNRDFFAAVSKGIEAMTEMALTQFALYPGDSSKQTELKRTVCETALEDLSALSTPPFGTTDGC